MSFYGTLQRVNNTYFQNAAAKADESLTHKK